MADWSMLPNDLLELIVGHFETSFHIVHFRSVCRSWRSVVPLHDNTRCFRNKTRIDFNADYLLHHHPWDKRDAYCTLKKIPIFLIRFQTRFGADYLLAETREKSSGKPMLMSSPLTYYNVTYEIYPKSEEPILFNSLTTQVIPFGHYYEITYLWRYGDDIKKFFGRADFLKLDSEDCRDFAVLGIKEHKLVMFTSRNLSWTEIKNTPEFYGSDGDIATFNGKFYVVKSGCGKVFAIEHSSELTEIPSVIGHHRSSREHLVKSGEELLLVQQFTPEWELYTWFEVFRLDEEGGRRRWVQVHDLKDRVIFLGSRRKLCCSVQQLPGAKENCIVFTYSKSCIREKDTILVFDLKTRMTSTAPSVCRGYMGAFAANLESLVTCGVVTLPKNVYIS